MLMSTPDNSAAALWPDLAGLAPSPSAFETNLMIGFIYAEVGLAAVAVLAFLVASAILVFGTKAKGRYFMLAGILLAVILSVYSWFSMRNLEPSTVLMLAAFKAATALSFAFVAIGYARVVWSLYGMSRGKSDV